MNKSDLDSLGKYENLDRIWNLADVAASKAAFQALLPDAEKVVDKDRSFLIELLSLIGRSEAFLGKFDQAHILFEKAEKLITEEQAIYQASAKMRWLIERGRIHILEKTPSQARGYFSEAWTLAIHSGEDYFAVEIAQLMAATEPEKAQKEWIVRAIEIAESSSLQKTKYWLGSLYTSLGWKLYDLRQYEKSLEVFHKALTNLKSFGTQREAFVAQWSIGKILRALGRIEEALSIHKALLAELGIGGVRDGRLYEELAECLHLLRRSTEAQLYFELAYRELSHDEWVTDNQPLKLKRLKDLGKVK
jgi:tetratricopeptide (TPR) repeat protein